MAEENSRKQSALVQTNNFITAEKRADCIVPFK